MSDLNKVLETALSKFGVPDENGDVPLWNSIENERFKIMIVDKQLMTSIGLSDASVQFHQDDEGKPEESKDE